MPYKLLRESNVICKNCDMDLGKLQDILSCPKCKEMLIEIGFDLQTKQERLNL